MSLIRFSVSLDDKFRIMNLWASTRITIKRKQLRTHKFKSQRERKKENYVHWQRKFTFGWFSKSLRQQYFFIGKLSASTFSIIFGSCVGDFFFIALSKLSIRDEWFRELKKRLFYNRCSAYQTFSMKLRFMVLKKAPFYQLIFYSFTNLCKRMAS